MSLIKDAQREPLFQPLGRRRESAITLSLIFIKPPFIHLPLRTAASTSPEEEAVECEEALARCGVQQQQQQLTVALMC